MRLFLSYSLRSLVAHRTTTLMTAGGIAIVALAFLTTLAIAEGLRSTFTPNGSTLNAIVLRKGVTAEVLSRVTVDAVPIIAALPGVARGSDGQPIVSPEQISVITLPRRNSDQLANLTVRGITPTAFAARPNIHFIEGRPLRSGFPEINVGQLAATRFRSLDANQQITFANVTWTVAGVFTSDDSAFESEIWADVTQVNAAFQRGGGYQSVTVRLDTAESLQGLAAAIEGDQRFELQAKGERDYYAAQAESMTAAVETLGRFVVLVLSLGAILGAMNTLYSAVARRTREFAVLRTLGFSRLTLVVTVMVESMLLGLIGGVLGALLAMPAQGWSTGAANFATFSEIAFRFRITPRIVSQGVGFALAMGLLGGVLPAIRAGRLPITRALREL